LRVSDGKGTAVAVAVARAAAAWLAVGTIVSVGGMAVDLLVAVWIGLTVGLGLQPENTILKVIKTIDKP
jgi:hypothetical protein